MLYTFFAEVPREVLEAARMDGATRRGVLPRAAAAVAAGHRLDEPVRDHLRLERGLLEPQPRRREGGALTAFIASFSSPEGLFWAKLSAASSVAIAPIVVFGWMSQRQLVRGLSFGAVK